MTDREKVMKGLECCFDDECVECPYQDGLYCKAIPIKEQAMIEIPSGLAMDALSLLKAQEPIPCGEKIKAGDVVLDFYECGYCKNAIRKPWRYCPFCGKEVKWDD